MANVAARNLSLYQLQTHHQQRSEVRDSAQLDFTSITTFKLNHEHTVDHHHSICCTMWRVPMPSEEGGQYKAGLHGVHDRAVSTGFDIIEFC